MCIGAAVIGAAVGNVAGQLAGNILGVQSGFNFASLGTSMLTAGLTQGVLGSANNPTGLGKILQGTQGAFSGYAEIAARAVVGNVISQGVGNITGSQKGFSWSSVAIAGIGAAAGSYAADKLGLNTGINAGNVVSKDLGRAALSAGANALSQVVVRGGRVNWQTVATDTILNFTSSRLQSTFAEANANKNAALVAQQRRDVGVDNEQLYSTVPTQKGDFTRELLNSQAVEAAEDKKYGFNGLRNTYFDNGLTSQDDLAAIQAGGLRVRALGEVKDVPPAQGIKIKADAEALNGRNGATKVSSQTPQMNGVASLYYQRDAATGLYIDPATNKPSYRISSEVQRKINDSALSNQNQSSTGLRPYSINNKYQLSDGAKNPSVTPEQYSKNFTDSFDRVIVGTTISAVPGIYGMATGLTVGQFVTGAAVSTSVSAAAQYKFNGSIETSELIGAALTGGFTYGRGLGYSMLVNTDGAINTALYNGEDLTPKVLGALIGTPIGAGVGYLAQQQLVKLAIPGTVAALINGNYSFANLISVTPSISSTVLSPTAQEGTQKVIDNYYENRTYRKYNK